VKEKTVIIGRHTITLKADKLYMTYNNSTFYSKGSIEFYTVHPEHGSQVYCINTDKYIIIEFHVRNDIHITGRLAQQLHRSLP
jgi:hypothetical protein